MFFIGQADYQPFADIEESRLTLIRFGSWYTTGLGFSLVEFSQIVRDQTGQTSENAVELFYKARVRDWLTIQPDLQYIARPSGIERDAFVAGLGFEVVF